MIDLNKSSHIHILGIGGAGMSAIAVVLLSMGHKISGSDIKKEDQLECLEALGMKCFSEHNSENLNGANFVLKSTAIPANNPEIKRAKETGLPILSRAEILAEITKLKKTIAIAGTHGKTTTASMLVRILQEAGLEPSFIIGGDPNEPGSSGSWKEGEWLVVEADESDGTFLRLFSEIAVITSLEPDHLSHYGSFAALKEAFLAFAKRDAQEGEKDKSASNSLTLINVADEASSEIYDLLGAAPRSCGTANGCDYLMTNAASSKEGASWQLQKKDGEAVSLAMPVPGMHNIINASMALSAAETAGVPLAEGAKAIAKFLGISRRFEFRGVSKGVTFIDDYAHLPSEITHALQTARDWIDKNGRLVCVFQPHRYSRVASSEIDFGPAFEQADILAITEIYPAGEPPQVGISGKLVADAALGRFPDKQIEWIPHIADLTDYLCGQLQTGDVCLTLGAGDLTLLPDQVLQRLKESTDA